MINNADIQSPRGYESAPSSPEARRSAVVGSAAFIGEQSIVAMYPQVALTAEFAISGYPDNAAEVARTSTAAAHQAIQGTIAEQRPEAN